MPTTQPTYDQNSLADMMSAYNYYLNPSAYTGSNDPSLHYGSPTPASNFLGHSGGQEVADNAGLDIGVALLGGIPGLQRFFGRSARPAPFQPYVDSYGNYVWTDPKQSNSVPLSNVPGASNAPTQEYIDMANQVRAVQDLLPQYARAISAQKIPDAMGQLAADTAVTGPRLALQEALQRQYGPIFDQLNAESNLRRSTSSAQNDLSVLNGPGKDLIAAALEGAKIYDPEYFNTRTNTANSVNALLDQTRGNLGKGMTNTERDEVGRGLALSNDRTGTANAPSQLTAVGNAMQFGAAGRARENDSQNQLSKAITASTAFLPQSRSNVDVFQVATGRPSYNQNDTRFNTNNQTGDASNSANALLNTGTSMWTTNQNNALTRQLNETNWMDTLSAITGAIGSVGGAVGGAMMCWIAREVYGANNPQWLKFRRYLKFHAPNWFYNWYLTNGEQFARYISDKPLLKSLIRVWMNRKIKQYANI